MSLRKHTDYNSYLTNLKYNNLGNYLSERNFRYVESQINSLKNIINTCTIEQYKLVYIYSTNSSGNGTFSNLGNLFNSYVFPCAGDNIELCWDSDKQNWCVKKYGGYFTNYTI